MSIAAIRPLGHRLVDVVGGSAEAFGLHGPERDWLAEDWEGLLRIAVANGVTSHLYAWLAARADSGEIEAAMRVRLQARARICSTRALALRAELLRVLAAFDAADLQVMPLKGPVLADLHHCRPALREFGDLDLLVHECDRERAWQLLLELGYHSPYRNHTLEQRYHVVFKHLQTDEMVELHWRIAGPQFGRYFRGDFLWSGAERRPYRGGQSVWQPRVEATVLYLAIHAYKHDWERLQWLIDIPEVLAHPGFDWDALDRLAHLHGAHRLLRATLQLSWALFPAAPRPPAGHPLSAPALRPTQLARVRRLMLRPSLDSERAGDFLALRVACADSLRDRLRLLWYSTQASDRDIDAVGAPPWMRPVARFIRPFRLLSRALGGRSRARDQQLNSNGPAPTTKDPR
jgi:hypothetical protein